MTWEQLFSALLAVGITVLVRLVNKWLPPDQYGLATIDTPLSPHPPEPMAGHPRRPEAPAAESGVAPPEGYQPPTPPDSRDLDIRE